MKISKHDYILLFLLYIFYTSQVFARGDLPLESINILNVGFSGQVIAWRGEILQNKEQSK